MDERKLAKILRPDEFLVSYDYGTGGLWGVLIAPSREAVLAKYPELQIADELPRWMDASDLQTRRETPLWLDDEPPQGLLKALAADRKRS